MLYDDIERVCVSEEEIDQITSRIAKEICRDYQDKNPLFVGLLKGCIPFMTDLLRKVNIECTLDYLRVKSYEGSSSTGVVQYFGLSPEVKDRNVIIIDDILDTGRTIRVIKEKFLAEGAKSVGVCVMLDKPEGRIVDISADYVGGIVPNEFVVGYGLDYNEKYRNIPYIGVLKKTVYSK